MDGTGTVDPAEAGQGVETLIPYVKAGEVAYFYPTKREDSYWPQDPHPVTVHDMRPVADQLDLDRNGFVLLRRPSAVKDFYDQDELQNVYFPEIQAIVKELTGARQVLLFGAVARTDRAGTPDGRLPSVGAHVDYTEDCVRDVIRDMLPPEEAEEALKHRFVEMNLWRPIKPVERMPLAICDASTVREDELNLSILRGALMDPNRKEMSGYNLAYGPQHRWYYVPAMQPDEILAFRLCDSDRSRVQWTAHTAIEDPTSAPDAKPRESIEIRTISLFCD